jgi:hypothetical protein
MPYNCTSIKACKKIDESAVQVLCIFEIFNNRKLDLSFITLQ